jgi:carbon-monoxide dehydrogenase medium subunit
MKAAPFDYVRPGSLQEACALLAADEDARIIAGGQTLVPMLAMRLARPTKLVDVVRLDELRGIRAEPGMLTIGAATRQVEVERSDIARRALPLLAKALPWVGHQPTRSRGTVGGSIAHADPSAEIPLVAVTLGAEIEVANSSGSNTMSADEFIVGPMLTAVMPGDCVRAVRFPVWSHVRIGTGFHEVSARQSDFAFVAAAAQLALDEEGRCIEAVLGLGGVGDRAIRIDVSLLTNTVPSTTAVPDIVRAALADVDIGSDLHVSESYRRRVAVTLGVRALEDAIAEAKSTGKVLQ